MTNLNAALEKYHKAEASGNVAEMIALQQSIRFNGESLAFDAAFYGQGHLLSLSSGGGAAVHLFMLACSALLLKAQVLHRHSMRCNPRLL